MRAAAEEAQDLGYEEVALDTLESSARMLLARGANAEALRAARAAMDRFVHTGRGLSDDAAGARSSNFDRGLPAPGDAEPRSNVAPRPQFLNLQNALPGLCPPSSSGSDQHAPPDRGRGGSARLGAGRVREQIAEAKVAWRRRARGDAIDPARRSPGAFVHAAAPPGERRGLTVRSPVSYGLLCKECWPRAVGSHDVGGIPRPRTGRGHRPGQGGPPLPSSRALGPMRGAAIGELGCDRALRLGRTSHAFVAPDGELSSILFACWSRPPPSSPCLVARSAACGAARSRGCGPSSRWAIPRTERTAARGPSSPRGRVCALPATREAVGVAGPGARSSSGAGERERAAPSLGGETVAGRPRRVPRRPRLRAPTTHRARVVASARGWSPHRARALCARRPRRPRRPPPAARAWAADCRPRTEVSPRPRLRRSARCS